MSSTDVLLHARFHHGVRTGHRLKFDSGSIDLLLLTKTSGCITETASTWSRTESGSRCGTAKATSSCTKSRIGLTCIGTEHASSSCRSCSKGSSSLRCTESSSSRFKCRTGTSKGCSLCLLSKTCGTESSGSGGLRSTEQAS